MTKQNFPVVDHYQVMRVTKGRVQVLLMPSSQRPPGMYSQGQSTAKEERTVWKDCGSWEGPVACGLVLDGPEEHLGEY